MLSNDLIIMVTSVQEINSFTLWMLQKFKMSDLILLIYYLGIEVRQSKHVTSSYAKTIQEITRMEVCSSCHIPMENNPRLKKKNVSLAVNKTKYRTLSGVSATWWTLRRIYPTPWA